MTNIVSRGGDGPLAEALMVAETQQADADGMEVEALFSRRRGFRRSHKRRLLREEEEALGAREELQ